MKLIDVIKMPVRDERDLTRLKRALLMTKWFARFDLTSLDISLIEAGYKKIANKHSVKITYVVAASEKSWNFIIRDISSGNHIYTVTARELTEGLIKSILVMFGYIEKGMAFTAQYNGNGEVIT